MPFQLNDYVRVKPGVLLEETKEPVPTWEGQIVELPDDPEDAVYLVELDALSLDQLPEKYLADCIENEEMPVSYYFKESELEPSVCRDTPEARMAKQDLLENLIFPLTEDELLDETQLAEWYEAFEQSAQYATLSAIEQEDAKSSIEMFAEFAFNYRGDQPKDWTLETLEEVCLEILPRKFTAKDKAFEELGTLLILFFEFLEEHQYLRTAGKMHRKMQKIAPEMLRIAKDPRNWGMAKGFAMEALKKGVDLNDKQAMEAFMTSFNTNSLPNFKLPNFGRNKAQVMRPARENPFKNFSRNQIIKVKYPDGNIREGKFKRLEEDLRSGKCELLA